MPMEWDVPLEIFTNLWLASPTTKVMNTSAAGSAPEPPAWLARTVTAPGVPVSVNVFPETVATPPPPTML